ncbi:helix-turn-helix domain-containing protein, partial [Salinicoccus sp. YB14-2]|uniref:helix-turn-helix domain-containing protein n=1 Tax=Salinicoccus sp. YB14-2 TaxID=1572701 RepID=UPI003518946B
IKGKHLTKDERAQIAILKRENYSNRAIAARLGRAPQTINNEINSGTDLHLMHYELKACVQYLS